MGNLLRCFGFTESRLHLGIAQANLALPAVRDCLSRLERSHEQQSKPNAESNGV